MASTDEGEPGAHPITIRRAMAEDLGALLGLNAQLHPGDPPPDPASIDELWSGMLTDDASSILVGAVPGGSVVTTCTLVIAATLTRGGRPWAVIENVVTHAGHRGLGYGKAVVQAAMAAAQAAGCYKLSLATRSRDEATLRFYESIGLQRDAKTYFEHRWP